MVANNNEDFRLYLNERFETINTLMNAHYMNIDERLCSLSDKLERIEEQTTKTNGRVTELEKKDLLHIIECPQKSRIDSINEDLREYRFFLKYPKTVVMGIIIATILTLSTFLNSNPFKVFQNKESIKTEITNEK